MGSAWRQYLAHLTLPVLSFFSNIRFQHLDILCSKAYWGQRSPKVIQGRLRSRSVKNKIIAIPHILLNYSKT